jgi:hypothetical protein
MICECGARFRRLHPDFNKCRCGATYDGEGDLLDAEQKPASSGTKLISVDQRIEDVQHHKFHNKPGSALESLIPDWVVQFKTGCGCKDYRKKMDGWGTEGCIARENQIIGHLLKQNDKLIPMFRGIPMSLKKMAAKKLLAKAIELSR